MSIILAAVTFLRANWKVILMVLILLPPIYLLGQCKGQKIGRAQMQHVIDVANAKVMEQQHRADTLAANQRLTDTIVVSHQEQELRNAIVSTPDSAPDATRIALGCERLRRADGNREAGLPSVCRPSSGAQTSTAR